MIAGAPFPPPIAIARNGFQNIEQREPRRAVMEGDVSTDIT